MKVYLRPQAGLSRAMNRVAAALAQYAPSGIQIVSRESDAELVLLHVIDYPETEAKVKELSANGQLYGIIQYCFRSTQQPSTIDWFSLWRGAEVVWSYYDLRQAMVEDFGHLTFSLGFNFYHSPLGIDSEFTKLLAYPMTRDIGVLSSGYVSGPKAEAITEVAIAAQIVGLPVVHIGPKPEGTPPFHPSWQNVLDIPDVGLNLLYARSYWVSGLRHCEGFEMPCIEGLSRGCRPFVFDRHDMRTWYEGHAFFIPPLHGTALIEYLVSVFSSAPKPVSQSEQQKVRQTFNWASIVEGFWVAIAMRNYGSEERVNVQA